MLKTIKGIYENGIITPLEQIDSRERTEVIITFLNIPTAKKMLFLSAAGSWNDVNTEDLKKEVYKNRHINTRKDIQL